MEEEEEVQNSAEEVQQTNIQESTANLVENVALKMEEKAQPVFLKKKENDFVGSKKNNDFVGSKKNKQVKNDSLMTQSSTKFYCDICSQVYDTKSQVAKHAREAHGKSQIYACKKDLCGYVTSDQNNLRSHVESHKKENENKDTGALDSNQTLDQTPQMIEEPQKENINKTKEEEETERKIYACFMCMYKTKDKYELKTHALTAHKDNFPAPIPPSLVKNNE